MSLNKPSPNSRFVFPTAPAKEGEEKKSEPDTLAMKREALRKRKEELEKKNEPKVKL